MKPNPSKKADLLRHVPEAEQALPDSDTIQNDSEAAKPEMDRSDYITRVMTASKKRKNAEIQSL